MAERTSLMLGFERWVRALRPLPQMSLAALAGALAALGQAPFGLWMVALIGLAAVFGLFRLTATSRHAARLGWAAGAGYFALSLVWIVEPFLIDVARHGWMAPFALVFLAGGLALFWGAGAALARLAGGHPLTWIAAMTGAEMLRSYIFTGFPWALAGYVLTPSPYAQLAAFVGPHGLSFLAFLMGVTVWRLFGAAALRTIPLIALLAGLLIFGAQLQGNAPLAALDAPVIRLIQPNAPQGQKWQSEMLPVFFQRQLNYTAARPAGAAVPDLIVWPETAVPTLLEWADEPLAAITAAAQGTPVVLGIQRREELRLFNSAILLGGDGKVQAIYDKHHLVPFGEYIPYGDTMAQFGLTGFAAREGQGYSSGPGPRLMDLGALGMALPLICYEAVFPQDIHAAPSRPAFLLQITNDAWFGRFSGPFQHLAQARMRAIEQGLPMVRAANTGVSAMIDARGRVTDRIGLGQPGYVDAALPAALPPTPYSRMGDMPLAALLVLGFLALAVFRCRQYYANID